jgi:HEAT repeat protein
LHRKNRNRFLKPTMKDQTLATVVTSAAVIATTQAASSTDVTDLIAKIKSPDDAVRGPAWQSAGLAGPAAVQPLAQVMTDANFEIARAAKRGLWKVVRYSGRPEAGKERKAVQKELLVVLAGSPAAVQREVLWMLSEIGDDSAVEPMAVFLANPELREDARCSLERIPGKPATAALKKAMASAPEEFRYALANSLRVRGEKVEGYPSRKLVPTKQTSVKAG